MKRIEVANRSRPQTPIHHRQPLPDAQRRQARDVILQGSANRLAAGHLAFLPVVWGSARPRSWLGKPAAACSGFLAGAGPDWLSTLLSTD